MVLVESRRHFQCAHCGTYHFTDTIEADSVRIVGPSADAPRCPVCAGAMAHALLDEHHPIDFCARCRGMLMPRTSFAEVTQRRRAWATSPPTPPSPLDHTALRRRRACPRCGSTFETYAHSGPGNVVIDNCTSCDLIWLDFGELRRIVDAPGRDRGSRETYRLDDEYVRRGLDDDDKGDTGIRGDALRKRDPLRLLADVLFG
jgi:Zn-finger nucleic acid-binding protein